MWCSFLRMNTLGHVFPWVLRCSSDLWIGCIILRHSVNAIALAAMNGEPKPRIRLARPGPGAPIELHLRVLKEVNDAEHWGTVVENGAGCNGGIKHILDDEEIDQVCLIELSHWLIDQLIDWVTDWLVDWLTCCLTDGWIDWLMDVIEICLKCSLDLIHLSVC